MLVEGKLSVRTYFDNNSQKERYSLEVSGSDFVLLGNKMQGDENPENNTFQRRENPAAQPAVKTAPVAQNTAGAEPAQDDDLPF